MVWQLLCERMQTQANYLCSHLARSLTELRAMHKELWILICGPELTLGVGERLFFPPWYILKVGWRKIPEQFL